MTVLLAAPLKLTGVDWVVPPVVLLELVPSPDPLFVLLLVGTLPLLVLLPLPLLELLLYSLLGLDDDVALLETDAEAVEFRLVVEVELRETKMPPAT